MLAEDEEEEEDQRMTDPPPTDDLQHDEDMPQEPGPPQADYWDISDDALTWARIHVVPRATLFVPTPGDTSPLTTFQTDRWSTIHRAPYPGRTVIQDDWIQEGADRVLP